MGFSLKKVFKSATNVVKKAIPSAIQYFSGDTGGALGTQIKSFLGDNAGSIIQGGMSLLGSREQQQSADQANKIAVQQAAQNIEQQREFAQNGIRWKVADAKAAGLHPLAALGAQTLSFSPVSVGVDSTDYMAQGMANLGQDISRAVAAHKSKSERAAELAANRAYNARQLRIAEANAVSNANYNKLNAENMALQNEILKWKISQQRSAQLGPGMPSNAFSPRRSPRSTIVSDVTSPTGAIEIVPSKITSHRPGDASTVAGTAPYGKMFRVGGKYGFDVRLPDASSASEASEGLGDLVGWVPAAIDNAVYYLGKGWDAARARDARIARRVSRGSGTARYMRGGRF